MFICLIIHQRWKAFIRNLVTKCYKHYNTADIITSNIIRSRLYDNSIRLVYGLRSIDKDRNAGKVLCAILNIPQPPTNFNIYNKTAGSALAEVSKYSMMQTARWTVRAAETEENDLSHITACFDGSWQKCVHTSLRGFISATSSDKEEVLHIEIIKKIVLFVTQIQPLGISVKRNMKEQVVVQKLLV